MTETAHLYVEVPVDNLDRTRRTLEAAGLSPSLTFLPEDTTPFGIFTSRDVQFLINKVNEYLEDYDHPERITVRHTEFPPEAQAHLFRIATNDASWARSHHPQAPQGKRLRLSRIVALDIKELAALLDKYPQLGNPKQENAPAPCSYCRAAPSRMRLADALVSGKYHQAHRPGLLALLRNDQDHHSITGVAVAELTNSFWVKKDSGWQVYAHEEFMRFFGGLAELPKEFSTPSEQLLQRLNNVIGEGDSVRINADGARALGLPENTEILWCRTTNMTPEQKEATGIPQSWYEPYLLDAFSFDLAAQLLREDPKFLEGRCKH